MDVAVLGGGPAGAVCARQLAHFGHSVLLLTRGPRAHLLSETLTQGSLAVLSSLGLADAAADATRQARTVSLMRWEKEATEQRQSDALLICRDRFDRALVEASARAGVLHVAAARQPAPRQAAPAGWTVPVGDFAWHARLLIDARGRRPARMSATGPLSVALTASWRVVWTHTAIEAVSDGWLWGAPLPGGGAGVCAVLAAKRLHGCAAPARAAILQAMLRRATLFQSLAHIAPDYAPVTVDVTPRLGQDIATLDLLCVGERAFTQDPLSSQGITAAITSALQGAAVANTWLSGPDDAALAGAFHTERSMAAARRADAHAGRLYAAAAERFADPFWTDRAASPAPPAVALPHWRPEAPIRASAGLAVRDVPILDKGRIRRMPALCHPALDGAVAFLGGVPLAPLVARLAPAVAQSDLLARWGALVGPDQAARVLAWMGAHGLVVTTQA